VEVVDNRDGTRTFERTMTEKEIGDEFTNQAQPLNWYPIRDEGEWGEEAEAAIAHAVTGAIPGNCTLMQHAMSGEVFALEYEGAESDTIIGVCGPLARNERDAALEDYDYNSEDAQWANGQPWNLYNRAAYEAE
ncbi:MAG TPA: hypothetical protein VJO13_09100, partial [Ktedonobacterales bacterium]|nr:hypothetical protein [Ktedonobacterales bacterium]